MDGSGLAILGCEKKLRAREPARRILDRALSGSSPSSDGVCWRRKSVLTESWVEIGIGSEIDTSKLRSERSRMWVDLDVEREDPRFERRLRQKNQAPAIRRPAKRPGKKPAATAAPETPELSVSVTVSLLKPGSAVEAVVDVPVGVSAEISVIKASVDVSVDVSVEDEDVVVEIGRVSEGESFNGGK